MLLRPGDELLMEAPRLVGAIFLPILLRAEGAADRSGGAGDVEAFVCDDRLGDDDRFALAAPDAKLNDQQWHVLGKRLERTAKAPAGALGDEDSDVRLAGVARTIQGPVVEDAEAEGGVNLAKLDFDAVVRVAVVGENVEASAAMWTRQLLSEDGYLAEAEAFRPLSEPVLEPDFVVAELTQPRGLAGVDGSASGIGGHPGRG